jgi:hypothetical protein
VNVEQPRGENEQLRAENMDYTRSFRDYTSSIVLPPTNATHFDLKPHVILVLPSFYGSDHENPYSHVKKFKDVYATFKFQISLMSRFTLDFSLSLFTIEPRHGWCCANYNILASARIVCNIVCASARSNP